jgi:proteasome lid subunit RPN8/RPN11
VTPAPLGVPDALLGAVFEQARAAFPSECCGWLSGPADAPEIVDAVRPCVNAQDDAPDFATAGRSASTAYVSDGDDLLALAASFDGPRPARVLYHSHPDGRACFSETDRRAARSPFGDGPSLPVQQLVVGLDAERVVEAALFAWSDAAADFVEVARLPGAAI